MPLSPHRLHGLRVATRASSCTFLVVAMALFDVSVLAPPVRAAPISWAAPVDGLFTDEEKWSPEQVPTGADDALFDHAAAYTVHFYYRVMSQTADVTGADVSFHFMGPGSTYTLLGNGDRALTVNGSWQVPGGFGTSGASLTILNGTVDARHAVVVGDGEVGRLLVRPGATLKGPEGVPDGVLGRLAGSSGSAVVEGQWTGVATLIAAEAGRGQLSVTSGGQVDSRTGCVGEAAGSVGEVTVAGSGGGFPSTWEVSYLTVGVAGRGTLTVEDGGRVVSPTGSSGQHMGEYTIGQEPDSEGSVIVRSNGSFMSGSLTVGHGGLGTLDIQQDGWVVTEMTSKIGLGSLEANRVTVDDALWQANDIFVGDRDPNTQMTGHGELLVRNGGAVEASTLTIGGLGDTNYSVGEVTITGSGSQLKVDGEGLTPFLGPLQVGVSGRGTLTVAEDADVFTPELFVGRDGEVLLTGGAILGGEEGSAELPPVVVHRGGVLRIEGGAALLSKSGSLGQAGSDPPRPTAKVVVTGNSLWSMTEGLTMGGNFLAITPGYGELLITDGGLVTSNGGTVGIGGQFVSGRGEVTIDGTGAWRSTGSIEVAAPSPHTPQGMIRLTNDGLLRAPTVTARPGGVLEGDGTVIGTVRNWGGHVKPGGSAGVLYVGGDYTQADGGQLDIEIEGLAPGAEHDVLDVTGTATLGGMIPITVGAGFVPSPGNAYYIVLAGTIVDDGFGIGLLSTTLFNADIVPQGGRQALRLTEVEGKWFIGDGQWEDPTNWAGGQLPQPQDLVVIDPVLGSRATVLFPTTDAFPRALVLHGGTSLLPAGGQITVGLGTTVHEGAALGGEGTLASDVLSLGTVSPGFSPGSLTIEGDYWQYDTGVLEIELGEHAFDQLIVTGVATLDGTLRIELLPDASISAGDVFDILVAEMVICGFATEDLPLDGRGQPLFSVAYSADTVQLVALADYPSPDVIPEPATLGLLGLGALAFLRRRQRR